jgi:hypothetical protein
MLMMKREHYGELSSATQVRQTSSGSYLLTPQFGRRQYCCREIATSNQFTTPPIPHHHFIHRPTSRTAPDRLRGARMKISRFNVDNVAMRESEHRFVRTV